MQFSLIICLKIQETVLHLTDMKSGLLYDAINRAKTLYFENENPGMV